MIYRQAFITKYLNFVPELHPYFLAALFFSATAEFESYFCAGFLFMCHYHLQNTHNPSLPFP